MHEPLKDCPFCGGAASLHNDTDSPCWFVGCSNSACPIEPCHYADTEAEAIATWNRRTPQPTQQQAGTPCRKNPFYHGPRNCSRWTVGCCEDHGTATQAQAGAVPLTCEWTHNEDDGFWDTLS